MVQKEVNQKEVDQKEMDNRESTSEGDQLGTDTGERKEDQWKKVQRSRRKSAPLSSSPSITTNGTKEVKEAGGGPSKEKVCELYNCQECDFRGSSV